MNKILVSDIIDLESGTYLLEFTNNATINIKGNVIIYINNSKISNLTINLKDKSILNLYKLNLNNNLVVDINQFNNTKLSYNETLINKLDNELIINNNILGNNNNSNISVRCLANNKKSIIKGNIFIKDNTLGNDAKEEIRGINNGGLVQIEPNIICHTNEVSANHLTTIGYLNKMEINYLRSKGITKNNAKKILLNAFIKSNLSEEFREILGGELSV